MERNDPQPPDDIPVHAIRSASISALVRVMDAVLMRIANLHRAGHSVEAGKRLSFVEGLLLHTLSMVQAMKLKVAEDTAPMNEREVEAFLAQLHALPEVSEPPHG